MGRCWKFHTRIFERERKKIFAGIKRITSRKHMRKAYFEKKKKKKKINIFTLSEGVV